MISTIFDILYIIHHILITEQRWQAKHRQLRSDQRKLGTLTKSLKVNPHVNQT